MRRSKVIVLILLGLPCLGSLAVYVYMQGLGDVRTDFARTEGSSAAAQQKGRALLARGIEALGGAERWTQLRDETVRITLQHPWHHRLLRKFFMPLEFSGQELSLLLRPGHSEARLTFLNGEWKDRAWGMVQDQTYEVGSGGEVSWERNETIAFNVEGYRYFFFLPFYLSEAELITYAGTQDLHGKTYDLVYATWGQWEPHEAADQYLIWIHRESSRVDYVQSTVREKFSRSIVSLSLSDYREVLGIQLPFDLRVLEHLHDLGSGMHQMKILRVESAAGDVSTLLRPDQDSQDG